MKKAAISGGGTAGHITPALSIAHKLSEKGWQIHYLGNKNSLEEKLLSESDFAFYPLNIQKIYRKFTFKHFLFPYKLLAGIYKSYNYLKHINPSVFLGCGGFVSGPPGSAAALLKIPLVLQEQNSYPGLTTRSLAKKADIVFLGNKNATKFLKNANLEYSGNPVNLMPHMKGNSTNTKKKTVFLLGGSQGSHILNQMMLKSYRKLVNDDINIIWQTGIAEFAHIKTTVKQNDGITIFDFCTNIQQFYQQADVIIARAGALTLAELEIMKKPAILIPLPSAAENHQMYNAREQVEKGIAELIEQKDLTAECFLNHINTMLKNLDKYRMKFAASHHLGAASFIAEYIDRKYGS